MKKFVSLALLALTFPLLAQADGVTDFIIDPATGITISTPGSYRLAANVTMTGDVAAIAVDADNVTLDLNGHTIAGLAGGGSSGIDALFQSNLTVRNGTVRDFGGDGIVALDQSDTEISDVTVEACLGNGIDLDAKARISRVTATGNAGYGIRTNRDGMIQDSVVTFNNTSGSFAGMSVGEDNIVRACNVSCNTPSVPSPGVGISANFNCIIENCIANYNQGNFNGDGTGIEAGDGCIITGNTCSFNYAGAFGILATGISTAAGCTVSGNTCEYNIEGTSNNGTSCGIRVTRACQVTNNVIQSNFAAGNGGAIGIDIRGAANLVKGNVLNNNAGAGDVGWGILVDADMNRIEDNHLTQHTGVPGNGIYVTGTNNFIRANSTSLSTDAGIFLTGTGNRLQENIASETTGIGGVLGNSLGTGDLANLTF